MSAVENSEDLFRERLKKSLEAIGHTVLPKLPEPLKTLAAKKLNILKRVLVEQREPRFAIVGRRGAGKSSLINAIFGAPVAAVGSVASMTGRGQWYRYGRGEDGMLILDTRGLGEGHPPQQGHEAASPVDEIKASLDHLPDAFLFLCKAKEVDARIDEDLSMLSELIGHVQTKHSYCPPVIGIATQVDELDPPQVAAPYNHPKKLRNIDKARELLAEKMRNKIGDALEVIPTSAYLEFSAARIEYDGRWNIDTLVEYLLDHVQANAKLSLARIARITSLQRKMGRELIATTATLASAVGLQPIPVADLPILTSLQISMIIGIAYLAGQKLNRDSAVQFLTAMGVNVGVGFVFRELARALVRLIPVAGNLVSGAVAFAATWGLGEAALAYFIEGKSAAEAQRIYQEARENKRKEKEAESDVLHQ